MQSGVLIINLVFVMTDDFLCNLENFRSNFTAILLGKVARRLTSYNEEGRKEVGSDSEKRQSREDLDIGSIFDGLAVSSENYILLILK